MTDRLEEIERRLRAAAQNWYEDNFRIALSRICGNQPDIDFLAHCPGKDGDVSFLLGEVRRLQRLYSDKRDIAELFAAEHDSKIKWEKHAYRAAMERDEAQSLALSLAEALEWFVENDDTNMMQEGNEFWIDGHNRGRAALSDERLTKLREMKNG